MDSDGCSGDLSLPAEPGDFGYTSPDLNHWARQVISFGIVTTLLIFFAPIAINPIVFPVIMPAVTVAMGLLWATFKSEFDWKRHQAPSGVNALGVSDFFLVRGLEEQ